MPQPPPDDAVGLAARIAAGELSPEEAARDALARLDARDPAIGAVALALPELALATARSLPARGGPLHGVPFLLKDGGAALAGVPQHAGSGLVRSLGAPPPAADSLLGGRLRAAGLVPLGTSKMPELGCQPTTQPLALGPTRNPLRLDRSAGGSSGGAAAAVAAGIVPLAHASDIGGSIRIPAAHCGLVGLKPSRGRTSILPIVDPNMVEHVVTRSVRDAAVALDVLAGPADGDPYALERPEGAFADALGADVRGLRVGLLVAVDASGLEVDPACAAAARRIAARLEELGCNVEEGGPAALFDDAFALHHERSAGHELRRVLDGLASAAGRPLAPEDVEPFTWALAGLGLETGDDGYAASQTWERAYAARVASWFADADLLLTPATGEPPPLLDELVPPAADPLAILPRFRLLWCFAAPFNVSGNPALALPAGEDERGPIGVQLVAPLGREDRLLAVASALRGELPA